MAGEQKATVAALAERFRLAPDQLEGWGVHNLGAGKGVGIRYRDTAGAERFVRRRTHVSATGHTYQPRGVPLGCYGLWRLHLAHQLGYLLVVEGESDCWACWAHDLPALGVPGADAAACLPAGIWGPAIKTVYVWQEPDAAGERFAASARRVLRAYGHVRGLGTVVAPPGIKDVADLRCADPAAFESALSALLLAAYPAGGTAPTPSLPEGLGESAAPAGAQEADPPPAPAPKSTGRKRSPKKKTSGREGVGAVPEEVPPTKATRSGRRRAPTKAEVAGIPETTPLESPRPKGGRITPTAAKGDSPMPAPVEVVEPPAKEEDPPDYVAGNSVKPLFRTLADVESPPIKWLVDPWIQAGKLTAIAGPPGSGKSTFGAWLAGKAQRTLIFPGGEEEADDEVRARLRAMKVPTARVGICDNRDWTFPADSKRLHQAVEQFRADLVWIDPADEYLTEGGESDPAYVRGALRSLAKVAQKTGAAIVFVRHPGKDPRNLLPGSRHWYTVPRAVIELLIDKANDGVRIVRPEKRSRGKEAPARYYHLDGEGEDPRVWRWGSVVPTGLVDEIKSEPDELTRRKIDRGIDLLKALVLMDAMESKVVLRAGLDEGLNDRCMERAHKKLGGRFHRVGNSSRHRCYWYIPGHTRNPLPTGDSTD